MMKTKITFTFLSLALLAACTLFDTRPQPTQIIEQLADDGRLTHEEGAEIAKVAAVQAETDWKAQAIGAIASAILAFVATRLHRGPSALPFERHVRRAPHLHGREMDGSPVR